VWRHIEAFAPVLGRLGVIKETWEQIERVEAVWRVEAAGR